MEEGWNFIYTIVSKWDVCSKYLAGVHQRCFNVS